MEINHLFELYPKQLTALTSPANFVFYGGAAGGGKSHLFRVAAIIAAFEVPGIQVYFFRREYKDLINNHRLGPTGFDALLAPINEQLPKGRKITDNELAFKFPNGSRIQLCHCQHDKDVYGYQGSEIHMCIIEEATQFSEFQIRYLLGRVRMPDVMADRLPYELRKKYPRVLAGSNPGGDSHQYWRFNFVSMRESLMTEDDLFPIWKMPKSEGGWTAQFIPATVDDNPSINPDQYKQTLMGLKRKDLIDAMLYGDWSIPVGAFFPEMDESRHRIRDFAIPTWWFRFRTFDWGSAAPFAVLWWAVSDGSIPGIPANALVLYREWYGASPFDSTKGLGLSNEQVCDGIRERSPRGERIQGTVTDSKPFQSGGGKTIAEDFAEGGVPLQQGDVGPGSRIQGWQQLRSRLIGKNGVPGIFFFESCPEAWRTLSNLQTSTNPAHKGEDCVSTGEDHIPDAVSLACKARAWVEEKPAPRVPIEKQVLTFDNALKQMQQERAREYDR